MRHRVEVVIFLLPLVGVLTACSSPQPKVSGRAPTTLPPATSTTAPRPGLSATSSPRRGALGSTVIRASATIAGVPVRVTGTIIFDVEIGTRAHRPPAYESSIPFNGPGTYTMPNGYAPKAAGTYSVGVTPSSTSDQPFTGLVALFGGPALTTTITR